MHNVRNPSREVEIETWPNQSRIVKLELTRTRTVIINQKSSIISQNLPNSHQSEYSSAVDELPQRYHGLLFVLPAPFSFHICRVAPTQWCICEGTKGLRSPLIDLASFNTFAHTEGGGRVINK